MEHGEHPDRLGNRNGLPATARDAANRALLDRKYATLQAKADDLRAELEGNVFGGTFSNADAGLEQVEAKLAALDRIRDVIGRSDRQLLTLDLTGERAEAAATSKPTTKTWTTYSGKATGSGPGRGDSGHGGLDRLSSTASK